MKKILIFVFLLTVFFACSDDDGIGKGNTNKKEDNFDRTQLTNAWVNDLWLPALTDLKNELGELEIAISDFSKTANQENLIKLRGKWLSSYKVWQHVHIFSIGVLDADNSTSFAEDMNTYPVDMLQIEENVNKAPEFSKIPLSFERHNDAQGFPSIDYLINGLASTDEGIITKLKENKYKGYLSFLNSKMKSLVENQITAVNSIDINSVGNDKNSFFSKQINDIVQYTEKGFREAKIAIPSGTRQRFRKQFQIDAGVTFLPTPTSVESRFSSENSKILYLESYKAIQNVYFGKKYIDGTKTTGIQNYLQFLGTEIMVNNQDILLDEYIVSLFKNIETANNSITDNFYEQTQNYNQNFNNTFDAIQEYVIALKGNALTAFNITIDFTDNDGD